MKPLLRRLWRAPLVAGWVALGLLLAGLLPCWPKRKREALRQRLACFWMRGLLRILPLRIHQHGQPTSQQAVWVGNHISWLDIIVLGAAAPVRFIAKSEVRQWPLLGWLAASAGTLFVRRGQAASSNLQRQMNAALAQGQSLMLFAEGTTTAGDRVRTFHGRLLSCALEQQVLLQPVALHYRQNGKLARSAAFIDDDEFTRHLWLLLGGPAIDVELYWLAPMDTGNLSRTVLAQRARRAVAAALGLETDCPSEFADAPSAAA